MKKINLKIFTFITILFCANYNHAIAKSKKTKVKAQTQITIPIDSSYFLEISTNKKNCDLALYTPCLFRDKAIDNDPYFHETKIIIFLSKILAFQRYDNRVEILKIKDLQYKFTTDNGNIISFDVRNGEVKNLTLLNGDLDKEKQEFSNCAKTEMLYDFYKTYNREDELNQAFGSYEDEYNFYSMSQYLIFASKKDEKNIMMMSRAANENFSVIKNLKICKFLGFKKANVKHISHEDCINNSNEECLRYESCKDYAEVEECSVVFFAGF